MSESKKKYSIKVNKEPIEVTQEVYEAYHCMRERERYLRRRDIAKGLVYYSDWDTSKSLGEEYIADIASDTEEAAIKNMIKPTIWKCVDEIEDKYNICRLIAANVPETKIAELAGVHQSTINRHKKKIFALLKVKLEKNL